jgi:salicylate hydroxylase
MKKKIAIIGAGVAGLTLANLLKINSNFEFIVYEKKKSLIIDKGYGIQLAANSVSILNKIGFKNIKYKKIYHPEKINFYSIMNNKICDLSLKEFNTESIKHTTLQRSVLIDFFKTEIQTKHLSFSKQIQKVSEIKDKILINFDDNTNDIVDYIVAADGIFSNTRSLLEKEKNKPVFRNAIAIRAILKSQDIINIDKKNINLIMGANSHLVIYPINKENELSLTCVVREKKFNSKNIKDLLDKKVISQNSNLKNLFQNNFQSWPLYSSQKILPSTNKKIFYLGDAFHGLLPTMAQGASQSIEGAFELFNLLKDNNNNAHNIYFENRSQRVRVIKKRSNFNLFAFHISNPIIKILRNFLLKRLVKNKIFINKYLGEVYKN